MTTLNDTIDLDPARATDCFQDRLASRNADVHLSAAGKVQGERLAHALRQQRIGRINSSPNEERAKPPSSWRSFW
jgi:hypothetical protein